MAEEKKNNEIEIDKSKIHASKMKKGRKTINYLQKCKDGLPGKQRPIFCDGGGYGRL